MEEKMKKILINVQASPVNHQKNIKLLENIYKSVQFEDFLNHFIKTILGLLQKDYKNPCCKLVLEFLAKFLGYISGVQNPQNDSELEDDSPSQRFLNTVIREVVTYHRLPSLECRYNACSFVSLTLQNVGEKIQMDGQICDVIQTAMLDNIEDSKPAIRLQAILSLVRLQDPSNPRCPVIGTFIDCLMDSSPLVRREAVKRIAPNVLTIPKLKDSTTDIDPMVRTAAFNHIADIGIKFFKIVHRQGILKKGFSETNQHVKKIFIEYLLPKWLTSLNGEYIAFLKAIKLDADENDILSTEKLGEKTMEVFFRTEPIDSLIKALPLDDKVIPLSNLELEVCHYWKLLTKFLRKSEEMDEYLETIIPELTSYCNYLEKLVSTKFSKSMEDWEYLEYQNVCYYLFDIAENYDLSEEVGRRTLDNLLKKVLRNHRLIPRLLNKIVQIASKLDSSAHSFTTEMCLIISDIREPLIEQEPSYPEKKEKEFQMAALTVKLNILEGDLEDAIEEKDFQKAGVLKNEIEEYRRKIEGLNGQVTQKIQVRVSKDDTETVCRCLDLLTAVLIYGNVETLTPSLITCREEFLKPLMQSKSVEVSCRVFKCLAVYCALNKDMAQEYLAQLMTPIASYRVVPNFNQTVLIASISIITDLIRLHGPEFFSTEVDDDATSSTQTSNKRKLYNEDVEDVGTISNQMSVEVIINVILDMLDDENGDIRDTAVAALAQLILNEFTINAMVVTRLILKWYNPATQINLQQKLGIIIKGYSERIKGSKQILAESVIPILTNIADAPRTSPLAEVDIDNVSKFLAAICDGETGNNIAHIHRDLARTLISEIASRPADVVTPQLAKMLNVLNIAPDNSPPTQELIVQANLVLNTEVLDQGPKQHVIKFMEKLKGNNGKGNTSVARQSTSTIVGTENEENARISSPRRLSGVIEEDEVDVQTENEESRRSSTARRTKDHENDNKAENEESGRTCTDNNNLRKRARSSNSVEGAPFKKKKVEPELPLGKGRLDREENSENSSSEPNSDSNKNAKIVTGQNKNVNSKNGKKHRNKYISQEDSSTSENKENSSESETSVVESSSYAASITSESVASASRKRGRPRNGKKSSEQTNQPDKRGATDNSKTARKSVVFNKRTSQSSVSDLEEGSTQRRRRKRDKRGLNNNKVGEKEMHAGALGGPQSVRRSIDRQVKKKTASGPLAKNISEESTKQTSDDLFDSSDQSLHTIVEAAILEGALDQRPNNTKRDSGVAQRLCGAIEDHQDKVSGENEERTATGNNLRKRTRPNNSIKTAPLKKKKVEPVRALRMRRSDRDDNSKNGDAVGKNSARGSATVKKANGQHKQDNSTNSKKNKNKRGGKEVVSSSSEHKDRSSESQKSDIEISSFSASTSSESVASDSTERVRSRKENKSSNQRSATKNSITARRSLELNNRISQSSATDVEEGSTRRRKGDKKGVNNIKVGEKEVNTRGKEVDKTVEQPRNIQVKRKKLIGHPAKKIANELTRQTSDDLFDSSDQSVHTIVEPSLFQMSLLPDDTPENSPQRSLTIQKGQREVVSEASSDWQSNPIRKSARKPKVCSRF